MSADTPTLVAKDHVAWPMATPIAVATPGARPPTSVLRIVRAVSGPGVTMTTIARATKPARSVTTPIVSTAVVHARIQPIHTGHYTMPADADRFPGERIVVTAFVIEHPRGVFLFDTGFSPEPRKMVDLYQPVYMRPIDEAL